MSREFDAIGENLSRGFIPKINQMPKEFTAANNTERAAQAFGKLAEFLMDSGEWIKLHGLINAAPAILEGTQYVEGVRDLAIKATQHAYDFEKFKLPYADYAESHGGPCQDTGIMYLDRYHQVLNMVRDPKTVLSIGCGDGVFDREVLNHKPSIEEYTIADASRAREVVDHLNNLTGAQVTLHPVVEDLYDWPTGRFDAVFALELIEHVPDQREFMEQAWKRVAPGGSLHISTPDARYWVTPHTSTGQAMQHITASTPQTLVGLIRCLPDVEAAQLGTSEEGHTIVRVDRSSR